MSSNNNNNNNDSRPRRGSFTTHTLTGLFGRNGNAPPPFPTPISTTATPDSRRRLSMTGVGLSATSPTFTTFNRRSSVSTAGSDSIDESAIIDDEGRNNNSTTPFARRISFGAQALRTVRTGSSPGNDEGFNWSEQFRSRAESSVSAAQSAQRTQQARDRAESVNEMQAPPTQIQAAAAAPKPKPVQQDRPKPDAIGERILRGQFMMD